MRDFRNLKEIEESVKVLSTTVDSFMIWLNSEGTVNMDDHNLEWIKNELLCLHPYEDDNLISVEDLNYLWNNKESIIEIKSSVDDYGYLFEFTLNGKSFNFISDFDIYLCEDTSGYYLSRFKLIHKDNSNKEYLIIDAYDLEDLKEKFNYLYSQSPNEKYPILNLNYKEFKFEDYSPIIIFPRIGNILYID